jgi:hypothetical protein
MTTIGNAPSSESGTQSFRFWPPKRSAAHFENAAELHRVREVPDASAISARESPQGAEQREVLPH